MPHLNEFSNKDSVYKIYSDAGTLPSKKLSTEPWFVKSPSRWGSTTHESSVTIIGPPTRPETLYSSEASNADYFTLAGVCKRTGSSKEELAVWAIRQFLENAIDYVEYNYDENMHSRIPTIVCYFVTYRRRHQMMGMLDQLLTLPRVMSEPRSLSDSDISVLNSSNSLSASSSSLLASSTFCHAGYVAKTAKRIGRLKRL